MDITTQSGFKCKIDEKKIKDWEFIKYLGMIDSEDDSDRLKGITKAVPFILGTKGEKALMDFLRKDNNVADAESVINIFTEIINKASSKN